MFTRVSKASWIAILAIFCTLSGQASPIGLYVKGGPIFYWGEKGSREKLAAFVGGAYQFNRTTLIEILWTPPFTTMEAKKGLDLHNALTFTWKNLIPLKYYLNIYGQWGFSWKSQLGLHAPFFGVGGIFYRSRTLHGDISWRNYGLLSNLRKGSPEERQNSIVFGIGYYLR